MLEKITSPVDLEPLSEAELTKLCAELRAEIIRTVSVNGGHLASSLGAVELTVALHRVFHRAEDRIVFDVGHQAYAHKLLTGRQEAFKKLRKIDGCSGFPEPWESPYDFMVCGHAGNSISTAVGLAAGCNGAGKSIAVVGDGALGCGISFEGLNAARSAGKNLLVILNDNQMSISRNVGALALRLNRLISGRRYNRWRESFRHFLEDKSSRHFWLRFFRRIDDLVKAVFLPPSVFFEELGFRYLGPVDGHSIPELLRVLEAAKAGQAPHLIHVITRKGKGFSFAEENPTKFHGALKFNPQTGESPKSKPGFSAAFGQWMCQKAQTDDRLVAISAAMLPGTGLAEFAKKFPKRCYDVGIAEEHATAFAAGLATAGKRPVVAIYATFIQRALDLIYHDVALAKLPVIFALDRAGAVEDGPTHHGIYDLGFLRGLPNLTIMMPRSEKELLAMLTQAYDLNSPVVVRYPRGGTTDESSVSPLELGHAEILQEFASGPVLWALGAECETARQVADILHAQGLELTLINTRYIKPFDTTLAARLAARDNFTLENHRTTGGLASCLDEALINLPHGKIHHFGWGGELIPHGEGDKVRQQAGLDAASIATQIQAVITA